jgi:hypothetical protein
MPNPMTDDVVSTGSSQWGNASTVGDMIAAHARPVPPTPVAAPAPVIPTNPTEAIARLEALKADPDWRDKFLAGNSPQAKEYKDLQAVAAKAPDSPVDAAMAGIMEDAPFQKSGHLEMVSATSMFREMGISDAVIRQTLTDQEVTQAEHDAVSRWRSDRMRDHDWVKKYLAGDGDQVRDMLLANIVLSSNIKQSAA